jgi:hypothetical protein
LKRLTKAFFYNTGGIYSRGVRITLGDPPVTRGGKSVFVI